MYTPPVGHKLTPEKVLDLLSRAQTYGRENAKLQATPEYQGFVANPTHAHQIEDAAWAYLLGIVIQASEPIIDRRIVQGVLDLKRGADTPDATLVTAWHGAAFAIASMSLFRWYQQIANQSTILRRPVDPDLIGKE